MDLAERWPRWHLAGRGLTMGIASNWHAGCFVLVTPYYQKSCTAAVEYCCRLCADTVREWA